MTDGKLVIYMMLEEHYTDAFLLTKGKHNSSIKGSCCHFSNTAVKPSLEDNQVACVSSYDAVKHT